MSIHVQLERFEGPLGLLLHLIREQEMDVFNINVHEITRQYLEYIKQMRRLDLEVAGEFVAMAATLIHIKSKTLLPQYNEEGEAISEDPRKELVQKLVEYKKFQELSAELYKRPLLGRDVLTRADRERIEPVSKESELVLEENPLFSLISAYRAAVRNMKKGVHKVSSELQSISSRILEMKDLLIIGKRLLFGDLLNPRAEAKSNHVLVTFLSLLELAKMGFISVFQNEPLSDIHVEPKRTVDRDVLSSVEDYSAVHASEVADQILNEAQLSLDEPSAEGSLAEELPVVQEADADAASDADIEAEEARLEAEASGLVLETVTFDALNEVAVDTEGAGDLIEMPVAEALASLTTIESPAIDVTEAELSAQMIMGEAEAAWPQADAIVEPDPVDDGAAEAEATEVVATSTEASPDLNELEVVVEAAAPIARDDLQTQSLLGEAEAAGPQIDFVQPEPAPEPEDVVKKNISSALNAAMSAFDAFEEIASTETDKDPEVES